MGNILLYKLLREVVLLFSIRRNHFIVLLAACNTNYEFTPVDIGEAGWQSDGGIYNNSNLGMAIDRNLLSIPEPTI